MQDVKYDIIRYFICVLKEDYNKIVQRHYKDLAQRIIYDLLLNSKVYN